MLLEILFNKLILLSIRLIVWRQSIINIQKFQSVYQEKTHIFVYKIHISVDFEVLKNNATKYVDGDQIILINFWPVALFREAKLTTSSGKHLEKVDNLHTVCL